MIGVLGGTFDPIHYGHLRPALEVQRQLELRELRFIPAAVPPHRPQPVASAQQRRQMVRLALAGQAGMVIDTRELDRAGPSYMVDTLASLREELGSEPLALILGMDALLGLPSWHEWERLNALAHLVVMQRPGTVLPESGAVASLVEDHQMLDVMELAQRPAGGVFFVTVSQLDISATAIREQLAAGHDARFCLPDVVLDYIRDEGLYGTKSQMMATDKHR